MKKIKKVGVLGSGLMGSGIAEVAARAGYETVVREVSDELLDKGLARIRGSLDRAVEKGKLDGAARDETVARLSGTVDLAALADCDIVVEAIVENLEEKRKTFGALDQAVKADALFASNTSSLTITQIAMFTQRPDQFVGLHFFNPVPVMKLVEVVRTLLTSDETFDARLRVRPLAGQGAHRLPRQLGLRGQPSPGALSAGRHPRPGRGSGQRRGHRQGDAARLRLPHGPVHPARLRGPRHHLLHRQHHVR